SLDAAPTARAGNAGSVKLAAATSSIAGLADAPLDAYTIALWVKPVARSSVLVVSLEDVAQGTLLMQLRVTGAGTFEHYVTDGASAAGCQSEPGSCIQGKTSIKGDTWFHVAVTATSGGDMHLYVGGFEEGAPRNISAFLSGANRFDFGYDALRAT